MKGWYGSYNKVNWGALYWWIFLVVQLAQEDLLS